MPTQWSKVVGFFSVFMGIILFCVIFGGYTSFWRAQNRIEGSMSLLTQACQERLDLLPGLIEMAAKIDPQQDKALEINKTAQNANEILRYFLTRETPFLETNLIKDLEISQAKLTFQLKALLIHMQLSLDKNNSKNFIAMQTTFNTAQNNLFVSKKRYNDEANYFNTRKNLFPIFLIAKLFGFNKLTYIELSDDLFLPAHETFASKTT